MKVFRENQALAPTLPEDEYHHSLLRFLMMIMSYANLAFVGSMLIGVYKGFVPTMGLWAALGLQTVFFGLKWLVDRRYTRYFRFIPLLIIVFPTMVITLVMGINPIGTIWLIVAITICGLLFDIRIATWLTFLSLIFFGIVYFLTNLGVLTPAPAEMSIPMFSIGWLSGIVVLVVLTLNAQREMRLAYHRKIRTIQLTESVELFESILNTYDNGIIVVDENMVISLVNKETRIRADEYGLSGELVGRKFTDVFSLLLTEEVLAKYQRVLKTGEGEIRMERVRVPAGMEIILQTKTIPLKTNNESPGLLIVVSDVTKLVKANEALEASEEKFRQLVENSFDMIVILQDGLVKYINPQGIKMLAIDDLVYFDKPIFDYLPEREHERIREKFRRKTAEDDAPQVFEVDVLHHSGAEIPIEVSVGMICYEAKPAVILVGRDISKRKQTEEALKRYSETLQELVDQRTRELEEAHEQLVRKEKLAVLGQLAGSVGHDLRNPLSVIGNAIYYLDQVIDEGYTDQHEYLDLIKKEIHTADHIVADLLGFARRREPKKTPTNASVLVREVIDNHPPPEKIDVSVRVDPCLPDLSVDPIQMHQVMGNLVDNAYQAMPDGGELRIEGDCDGRVVSLAVIDNGVGISEENKEHLFEPLFTTKPKGVGLGLATSLELTEMNGGEMQVESEVGDGTCFTIRFPLPQHTKLDDEDDIKIEVTHSTPDP